MSTNITFKNSDIYVFSEYNEKSTNIAKRLLRKAKVSVFFTNTTEKNELDLEVQKIPQDITEINHFI